MCLLTSPSLFLAATGIITGKNPQKIFYCRYGINILDSSKVRNLPAAHPTAKNILKYIREKCQINDDNKTQH